MWGIYKKVTEFAGGKRECVAQNEGYTLQLEVGLAASRSPRRVAPSGVSENTAIVLSLRSARPPFDNDDDLNVRLAKLMKAV